MESTTKSTESIDASTYPILTKLGFKLGDIVTWEDSTYSPGGSIYEIVEVVEPVEGLVSGKVVKRTRKKKSYNRNTCKYVELDEIEEYDHTIKGYFDKNGKKHLAIASYGYIRIKPIFVFYGSTVAMNPNGKDGTFTLVYRNLNKTVVHVSIVELGIYVQELQALMCKIATT